MSITLSKVHQSGVVTNRGSFNYASQVRNLERKRKSQGALIYNTSSCLWYVVRHPERSCGRIVQRGALPAGAKNITLDGVFHSPLGASPPAAEGEAPGLRPWYGSKGVLERWIEVVEQDIGELSDDVMSVGDIVDSSLPPR